MYSDKKNVNILTALLVSHGVRHVFVCPGSRNAPLVHNFDQCPDILCHPVTDERSAAFMALGMSQVLDEIMAVCVTSGSALLNLLPAAAEATNQHQGILIISADRPSAWIGQLDGQTLPQPGALGSFVAVSTVLPEPYDAQTGWECNRKANEALLEMKRPNRPSVHINVPISEPLFKFDVAQLPEERAVRKIHWEDDFIKQAFIKKLSGFRKHLLVMGQLPQDAVPDDCLAQLMGKMPVLFEVLSADMQMPCLTDKMLCMMDESDSGYLPDCVIYLGGNTVSKRLRRFMRESCKDAYHVVLSEDGTLHDISCHTNLVIEGRPYEFVSDLNGYASSFATDSSFAKQWTLLRQAALASHCAFAPAYSQMLAVKLLEQHVTDADIVHYANSMSVRLGAIFATHHCFCNRGLNGIEGSLSTAAGAALALESEEFDGKVYHLTGDLSFFYDENALWQTELGGNLRILLMNNGQGGIFKTLSGLEASPARDALVCGKHSLSAEGVCRQFSVNYRKAQDRDSLEKGIKWLCGSSFDKPALLEVLTDPDEDIMIFNQYFAQ